MRVSMSIDLGDRKTRNQTSKREGLIEEPKSLRGKSRWHPVPERLAFDRNDNISCTCNLEGGCEYTDANELRDLMKVNEQVYV